MINDFRFGGPPVVYHLFFDGNGEREGGKEEILLSDLPRPAVDGMGEERWHGVVARLLSRIVSRFSDAFAQAANESTGVMLKAFVYRYTAYFILFAIVPR